MYAILVERTCFTRIRRKPKYSTPYCKYTYSTCTKEPSLSKEAFLASLQQVDKDSATLRLSDLWGMVKTRTHKTVQEISKAVLMEISNDIDVHSKVTERIGYWYLALKVLRRRNFHPCLLESVFPESYNWTASSRNAFGDLIEGIYKYIPAYTRGIKKAPLKEAIPNTPYPAGMMIVCCHERLGEHILKSMRLKSREGKRKELQNLGVLVAEV